MKTFKQFIKEMRKDGPSSPIKYYEDGNKFLNDFGAGRINNIRLKGGKTIADLIKGV